MFCLVPCVEDCCQAYGRAHNTGNRPVQENFMDGCMVEVSLLTRHELANEGGDRIINA